MSGKPRTPRVERTGHPVEVTPNGSVKIKDPRRAKIEIPDFKGESFHLTQTMVQKYLQLGYEVEKQDGFTITMTCPIENVRRIEKQFADQALANTARIHGNRDTPTQAELRDGAIVATVQKLQPVNIGDFADKAHHTNAAKEAEINEALAPHVNEIAKRMFDIDDD